MTLGYTDNQGSPLIFVCSIDITFTLKKNNNIQCYYIIYCILHHYLWNNKLYTKIQKISQDIDLIWHFFFPIWIYILQNMCYYILRDTYNYVWVLKFIAILASSKCQGSPRPQMDSGRLTLWGCYLRHPEIIRVIVFGKKFKYNKRSFKISYKR